MTHIRREAPYVEIEIIASNDVRDLLRREADIAIRHGRPDQGDLIAKRIGETSAHFYASKRYLDRIGRPTQPDDLAEADFIGFEQPERLVAQFTALGIPVTADQFKISTASGTAILAFMEEGLGIGVATKDVAGQRPLLQQVLPNLPPIQVPVWLVTHRELHTSRRIRLVFDLIAEHFPRGL